MFNQVYTTRIRGLRICVIKPYLRICKKGTHLAIFMDLIKLLFEITIADDVLDGVLFCAILFPRDFLVEIWD